jgi:hypothetical protein
MNLHDACIIEKNWRRILRRKLLSAHDLSSIQRYAPYAFYAGEVGLMPG